MTKKINVKPIERLTLEFADGDTRDAKFSAYAMMVLDDEFGGFKNLFEQAKEKPFLCGAKLLYAGMKSCDESMTIEFAKKITTQLSVDDILQIFDFAADTIGEDEEKKTNQMNRAQRRASRG